MIHGALLGYLASAFLRLPLHRERIPELARYTVGGLLVLAAFAWRDQSERHHETLELAAALLGVGLGVAAARLNEGGAL